MAHIVQLDQSTILGARNHGGRVSHLVVQPFPQPQPLQGMGVNWVKFELYAFNLSSHLSDGAWSFGPPGMSSAPDIANVASGLAARQATLDSECKIPRAVWHPSDRPT